MSLQNRRDDTRTKIQLGGLVIKAGLENEDTAMLLGALLSAGQALQTEGETDAGDTAGSATRRSPQPDTACGSRRPHTYRRRRRRDPEGRPSLLYNPDELPPVVAARVRPLRIVPGVRAPARRLERRCTLSQ